MTTFFPSYSETFVPDIASNKSFDNYLNNFLSNIKSDYTDIPEEFKNIKNFLKSQPSVFFEESFLTTCSKIIQNLSNPPYHENHMAFAQYFLLMVKEPEFKNIYPKLQNYGVNNTFGLIAHFLQNNQITLAQIMTDTFIHPEKRTIKSFTYNLVEWCLKNTKIAALNFLVDHYEGFNTDNVQALFLSQAELGKQYLSKVFPNHVYPTSLSAHFLAFFSNTSIVLSKKLELISYFSKTTDFMPKEMASFIVGGLKDRTIALDSLKEYDFYSKITSQKTLSALITTSSNYYINTLRDTLSLFYSKDNITPVLFDLISNNDQRVNGSIILHDFIIEYPQFSKEKSKEIEQLIVEKKIDTNGKLISVLMSSLSLTDDFYNDLIVQNQDLYFIIKNPETDSQYMSKASQYVIDKGFFPYFLDRKYYQPVVNKLCEKLNNDQLVNLFFLNANIHNTLPILKSTNITIVIELSQFTGLAREKLLKNLSDVLPYGMSEQLLPKKWYQISLDKPLQVVLKAGEIIIVKKESDKVAAVETTPVEDTPSANSANSVSNIIVQAKKDLDKFNQLTSEPLDYHLEFKIRSESIFMQQMNFLTQIQKIENDLKFEDLYFLKNNLGKYLIQCTETYSRALKRHQTLLENPGLFKKQDNTLDSQKEKIDSEALKQVTLLEKELAFVKDNVINTINSDSYSDMRINTRFLEATIEHDEASSIVKLVSNKPR